MIWRYAIKRLLFLTSFFLLFFGGLQLTFVQNKLLSLFVDGASFSSSSGFFPFDFSVNDFQFRNSDFLIEADNIKIKLSKSLFSVKKVSIANAKVKQLIQTKLMPSDFKIVLPFLFQKVVSSFKIDALDFDGLTIKKVKFNYNEKLGIYALDAHSQYGVLILFWKLERDNIFASLKFGDLSLHGLWGVTDKHFNFEANYQTMKVNFDGVYSNNSLNGILSVPKVDYKPTLDISTEEEFIKIGFREEKLGLSGNVDLNLDKLSIFVNELIFDNGIVIMPFSVIDFSKIPEVLVLLKSGKIQLNDLDFSNDNFSFGKINFTDIELSQFFDSISGKINGNGFFKDAKEHLNLQIKNFKYDEYEIPIISIKSDHSADLISFGISFDFLKNEREIDGEITTKNWIPGANSKLDIKTSGRDTIANLKLPDKQIIRGEVNYKLKLTGSIEKPNLDGLIGFKNGLYVYPEMGIYVRDIKLESEIKKNDLFIEKIHIRDDSKKGGTIQGEGKILYRNGKLNTNISLSIDKFKIIDQNWIIAKLFGNLKIVGDLLSKISVSGSLYTENPKIDISSMILLSTRSLDLFAKKKKKNKSKMKALISVPIDIKFDVKPELKVTGFGFDTFWSASGYVSGDIFDLNYVFNANLKSGKIQLTDNAFKLKDGVVLINKDTMNVQVSAEKKVDKILVGAKFIQRDDSSDINFYSKPYLSQKDILSYILFDKSSSDISMGEGMTLLTAMNKLSGGADFDILGKMKTMFGIDSVSVKKSTDKASGEEYNAVSIGKKFGKFNVSIDQGSGKDTTNITVDTKIAKNAKITVDLSGRDSFRAGVSWSKRY